MVMSRTNWTLLLKFKLIGTIVGLLVGTTFVADALLIRAFNATGSELFAVEKDQEPTDVGFAVLHSIAYLTVGNGPKLFEVWMPTELITFVTACALHDIVVRNPDITGKVNVVGWGAVGDAPICNGKPPSPGQPPLPCPDVIILGTTQISGRFYKGELESMEEYFASYAQESQTGMNIIDDFSKGVYYDYKIGDTWTGVPLSTDVRAVSYNRTVFKELKLKEPPPMESWGEYDEEWTWDTFLEYATILKNSGKSSAGFKLLSIVHEEFHCLMTTVGRLVNVRLIESNGTCGLRKANWYDALEKYVRKPLQDGIFNHMYDRNMLASVPRLQNFLKNTDPNSSVIAELDVFPMLSQIAQWDFGNVLDGMGLLPVAGIYAAWLSNPNETGYAFPPRGFTFLGGTGLVIPKYATQKETSWDFIVHMTDKKESFIRRWNNAGAVPPLESAADHPVYKTPFHTFSRALMKRAIPDHYPGAPYRFYKELDTMAPFRMMLLEMALKNFSAEVATRRACEVIELLAQRECNQNDYEPVVSECFANNTKTVFYRWKATLNCKNGTVALPAPISNINCSYIVASSALAIGIEVLTFLGAFATILYAIAFLFYKNRPAIKAANVPFCMAIFLGAIFLYLSVFLQTGQPNPILCLARIWFVAVGFGLLLGGLLVKMMQISAIFSATMSSSKEAFSLSRMMQHLTTIIVIEIAALAALSIVGEPGAGVVEKTIDLRGIGSYTQQECAPLNQITVVTLISINVVLIIFSSYTAWMSRKVPDSFNETKFVVVAILLISFTAIVVLPVLLTFGGLTSGYLLGSLAVNFATTFSMGVFALPKLWMARLNVKSKVSDFPGRTVARTVAVDVNDM